MTRSSLLIECSSVPNNDPLPGAKVDVTAYHDWLYSKAGGDWFDSEIKILHTPTVAEVKAALAGMAGKGYAFVTFSGHGYHGKERNQTRVSLKDGHLSVHDLIPAVDRCTVLVDACRNVMRESLVEAVQLSLGAVMYKAARDMPKNYRQVFEEAVLSAERGTEILYSCDLNESAGENSNGGFFSRSLVEIGQAFSAGNHDGSKTLLMNAAFNGASSRTQKKNAQQHPQFEPGRRLVHFPFGV